MRRWLKWSLLVVAGLVTAGVAARALNPLPPLPNEQPARALTDTADTRLGRALAPSVAAHPGETGLHLLVESRDAFAARALLARAAERSIDAQYYMWHDDLTGGLLLEELRAAAERGVRVRLLLDDNNTSGLDPLLAGLNDHPNIELRLFNPFTIRNLRPVNYAIDFARLNRRMHNKSFTIDNQATIIGGRNIGDEYFGSGDGALFVDLDALAVGSVVGDVSEDFDRYWASASAYPAASILPRAAQGRAGGTRGGGDPAEREERDSYLEAVRALPIIRQLIDGELPLEWARVRLISDDPAKALGREDDGALLITHLEETLGRPRERLRLVSGYFVPTDATVDRLSRLSGRGVEVTVVTNSIEATDVPVVHAGYAGDRKALLEAGVRLWEIRLTRGQEPPQRRGVAGSGLTGGGRVGSGSGTTGGAPQRPGQALHAKTFIVDGERLFIGSFNLDPRSAHLNTELGFVIESPALARVLETRLAEMLPTGAYQVRLQDGELRWVERRGSGEIVHEQEPGTNIFGRTVIAVLSRLPIEWML